MIYTNVVNAQSTERFFCLIFYFDKVPPQCITVHALPQFSFIKSIAKLCFMETLTHVLQFDIVWLGMNDRLCPSLIFSPSLSLALLSLGGSHWSIKGS